MDVWECDLVDVHSLRKYNDGYRYELTVIDVFSKFLHMVPLRIKTGKAVASAFLSVLGDKKYSKPIVRRPTWVRTDRGKEFLNRPFQDMLKKEGMEFQVCTDPNVICAVVERIHRIIRDRLYKYFTHKNTYKYIDVLPKFVAAYNDTVHGTTGMAPSKVGESDVLATWNKMRDRQNKIKTAVAKFKGGSVRENQ
jgi:transposase InsO family protein